MHKYQICTNIRFTRILDQVRRTLQDENSGIKNKKNYFLSQVFFSILNQDKIEFKLKLTLLLLHANAVHCAVRCIRKTLEKTTLQTNLSKLDILYKANSFTY